MTAALETPLGRASVSRASRASGRRALRALARAHGVQTGYIGDDGRRHLASDEVLMLVLGALGSVLQRPEDALELTRAKRVQEGRRVLQPVIAHREGAMLGATINLPDALDPGRVWVALSAEDGSVVQRRLLVDLSVVRTARLTTDGARWVSRRVHLRADRLPTGYQRLQVEAQGLSESALVLSAPRQAPAPGRSWGAFLPLYALRTEADWGVGSFTDLARLGEWIEEVGGRGTFVGTLPLTAVFADVPFADPSPYLPASRLAWNEAYIDIEKIPELEGNLEASSMVESAEFRQEIAALHSASIADPRSVARLKRRVLSAMVRALRSSGSSKRLDAFERFVSVRPELVAYAGFRSACERIGRPFQEWRGIDTPIERDESGLTHLYAQWIAEEQLSAANAKGNMLYLDFPVGVHPSGFDIWWQPENFAQGASAGAPPDSFFSGGQTWGFPPLHPERVRDSEYSYFAAALRHCMRHASILRVDHVMGLHRMYFVPDGVDARDGVYVRYNADEFHAVLCLEAHRAGTVVVGEDLGTVPGVVRRAMERDGIQRSFVFEFASTEADPLPTPPVASLATLETHDLPPFAAFWRGLDVDDRRSRGEIDEPQAERLHAERRSWCSSVLGALGSLGSPGSLEVAERGRDNERKSGPDADEITRAALAGCLAHLSAGPARLVMVDLEDLWLETEPQNRPGTGVEFHNFLRRAGRSFEQLSEDAGVVDLLSLVDHIRARWPEDRESTRQEPTFEGVPR